jgi:hypothetical protein
MMKWSKLNLVGYRIKSVINYTDFEFKSPLRSDLNYPESATLNLDEKEN